MVVSDRSNWKGQLAWRNFVLMARLVVDNSIDPGPWDMSSWGTCPDGGTTVVVGSPSGPVGSEKDNWDEHSHVVGTALSGLLLVMSM